jgi:hypothetical protein
MNRRTDTFLNVVIWSVVALAIICLFASVALLVGDLVTQISNALDGVTAQ